MHDNATTQPPAIATGNAGQIAPEFVDHKAARALFGLTRSHLYALAAEGHIRSVSLRRPGTTRGRRLFVVASLRDYLTANIV